MDLQRVKVMESQKQVRGKNKSTEQIMQSGDRIEVVYYTDPLCCWSWAMEPQWRRIQYEYRDIISTRYCMGGLLSDWNHFNDAANFVSRPIQMGPVWAEAHHLSGMPVSDRIWMKDPPASSYTACVAVKCAARQSTKAEENFLRKCREELMINGINIAKQQNLFHIAEHLEVELNGFSADDFKQDYISGAGVEEFRNDLKEVRYKSVSRFPSIKFTNESGKAILLTGYEPYESLRNVFNEFLIHSPEAPIEEDKYKNYFGSLLERELAEAVKLYP